MIKLLIILLLFIAQSAGAQLATGSGTIGDPFQIWYLEDLANTSTSTGASYSLERDLDFLASDSYASGVVNTDWTTGGGWSNYSSFSGTLDGKGHSISNLMTKGDDDSKRGLFRFIASTASVTRLIFINPSIDATHDGSGRQQVGVLVGDAGAGHIEDVHVIGGSVKGALYVGGIAGKMGAGASIVNCTVSGASIEGLQFAGGIVGFIYPSSNALVSSCTADVAILSNSHAGGIAGALRSSTVGTIYSLRGAILNSAASVTIDILAPAGYYDNGVAGVVGSIWGSAEIYQCSAVVDITATFDNVGGVVGNVYNTGSAKATIDQCFVTGEIKDGWYAGGFIGRIRGSGSTEVADSYSQVEIYTSFDYAGGFAQSTASTVTFSRCYSTGIASATVYAGGFSATGTATETVQFCYWDTESSGLATSAVVLADVIEGKTTAEMYQQATFTGWDFASIWSIEEGTDYPRLQWALPEPGPEPPSIKFGIGTLKFSTNGTLKFGGVE